MEKYRIDFGTMTFKMSKEFAKKVQNPTSDEFKLVAQMKESFPQMDIQKLSHRSSKSRKNNPDKGFGYEQMERYIKLHENADDLLAEFKAVKEAGKSQKNAYLYVKNWFEKQYPNFREVPDFTGGKLKLVPKTTSAEGSEKFQEECKMNTPGELKEAVGL